MLEFHLNGDEYMKVKSGSDNVEKEVNDCKVFAAEWKKRFIEI